MAKSSLSPTLYEIQSTALLAQGGQIAVKEENITRVSWEEWGKMKGNTDWGRLRNMTEEEIERNALDDPDALPYTEEELEQFEPVPFPPPEEWLRSQGITD